MRRAWIRLKALHDTQDLGGHRPDYTPWIFDVKHPLLGDHFPCSTVAAGLVAFAGGCIRRTERAISESGF